MKEDYIEKFFEVLITDEKEREILKLLSKNLTEEEIIEILLNNETGEK